MSGPCLEDHIEWRFRCLAHLAKSALRDRGRELGEARLRSESRSDRLIERGRTQIMVEAAYIMRLTGLRLSCSLSPAAGSTIIQLPSGFASHARGARRRPDRPCQA